MQPQIDSASVPQPSPGIFPAPEPPGPKVVRPQPGKPGRVKFWLSALVAVLAMAGLGLYLRSAMQSPRKGGKGGGPVAVRMAPILVGDLHRTIRLSGTIQAEKFAALLAPQMRGSRSGRGRGGGGSPSMNVNLPSGGSSSSGTSSDSSGSSSSSSSSSSSTASLTASSDTSDSSSGDVAASRTSISRTPTNRFASTTGSSLSSSSGGSAVSSTGSGASGITTGSGGSTGGMGGGGGNDFMLVLLSVAKPGSHVKKGDVVAEFDRQYMMLRLDDYRASGDQMDGNISKLKADLLVAKEAEDQVVIAAKAELDKALLDLKTIEVRSQIDSERFKLSADQAQARYKQVLKDAALYEESWRAQLKAVEIDREQARIELRRAETNADRMLIKAPIDGIVVMQTMVRGGDNVQIREGDQVFPGMFFMSIVDLNSMIMNGTVNQADSEALRLGLKARISLDAYPEVEIPGTVTGVGAMTNPGGWRASYVREIPVRLKLDGADSRIIPDLSASADVVLASERETAIAPRAAVFRETPEGRPFVWMQGPQGWLRREIELGLESNTAVAVRSGLRKGDVVAVEKPPLS